MGAPSPPGRLLQLGTPLRWTSVDSPLGRWAQPRTLGAGSLSPWPGRKLCRLWGQVGAYPCASLLGQLLIKSLQSQQCA